MGALSQGELAGERIAVAYDTKDQEDEHSCFSDNTTVDIVGNTIGIRMIYTGEYDGVDGPSLSEAVAEVDPEADAALREQLDANVALAEALEAPFDQLILGEDDAPGRVRCSRSSPACRTRATRSPRWPATSATRSAWRSSRRCGGRHPGPRRPPPPSSCSRAPTTATRRARPSAPTDQELADQGGDATVEITGSGAFAQPVPGLDSEQRRDFAVGNNFFNDNWVTAPPPPRAATGSVRCSTPSRARRATSATGVPSPRPTPTIPSAAC